MREDPFVSAIRQRPDESLFVRRFLIVVMFFGVWVIAIAMRLVSLMLPPVTRFLGTYGTQAAIAGSVTGLGFLAFEFKNRDLLNYARLEICFGIASVFTLTYSATPDQMHLTQWASLAGAAYVIARGRSNLVDAMKAHRE